MGRALEDGHQAVRLSPSLCGIVLALECEANFSQCGGLLIERSTSASPNVVFVCVLSLSSSELARAPRNRPAKVFQALRPTMNRTKAADNRAPITGLLRAGSADCVAERRRNAKANMSPKNAAPPNVP